ncbi:prophage ps3 protein 13 [Streptococcus infantarius subsp. infantarius]|nr:prophage ps3 protein 13 [Streptococcus infantarius subsp. infantarius]MCO4489577.1 prophage ps3 protein 13 [Streptococcus infantarius subsp. infantarius]MCO4491552.1 prophage ps3 protein 13 [Streptococcus infantarius subsp. infantarius]MCO4498032.1 prophage ps3 protein 13 [Streptococcus infantarius subsp. infantarius]MCO4507437.1 prophage ps3 protein 13 [Streptococcus infantarius subsp. infantarius]
MNLVYLDGAKEPYTTSEIIAECADVQHHTITRLIRENKDDFEALGILGFKIHKLDGRGQPKKAYILNEQQATLLITYLKNTEPVREFKKNLVKAFFEMRDELSKVREQRALEKPTHKTLNEAISKWDNAPKPPHGYSIVNNLLLKLSTGKNKAKLTEDRGSKTGLDCLTSVELAKYQAYEKAVISMIELNMEYSVIRDTLSQVQL